MKISLNFALLIAIVIAVGAYSVGRGSDSLFSSQEVTIYPVQCDDWIIANTAPATRSFQDCLQRRAMSRIGISVNEIDHEVVQWLRDETSSPFYKGTNCTILDSNNWSCDNGNFITTLGTDTFGFKDGNYFNSSFTHVIFVNKSQWNSVNGGQPTPFGAEIID